MSGTKSPARVRDEPFMYPHLDGVFRCPLNVGYEATGTDPTTRKTYQNRVMPPVCYGYNEFGVGVGGGNLGLGGRLVADEKNKVVVKVPTRDEEVRAPSDMIALGDLFNRSRNARWDGGQSITLNVAPFAVGVPASKTPPKEQASFKNHRGRFNRFYLDGHLEFEDMNGKFAAPTDDYLKRWNKDNEPHREYWSLNP